MGYDAYDEWKPRAQDGHVCQDCVTDGALAYRIQQDEDADQSCDYCGKSPAAPLQTLVDWVYEGIETEWTDPANELPYESAEGGYQGQTYDGYELIMYELAPWTDNNELLEDVARAFSGYAFSEKDYFMLSRDETLRFGWERFKEQVKHRTRYLFLEEDDEEYHPDNIPPAKMLAELGEEIRKVDLIRVFEAGTEFVRVRVDLAANEHTTPGALGTPERQFARQPNRMSPAGIPMFYAALEEVTALAETVNPLGTTGQVATVGRWVVTRDIKVLDLTNIEPVPSIYDEERRHLRGAIQFLHSFAADLSRPVDGTEHIDYVPTQVVTEYFRHRFRTEDREPVDGILYTSSRTGEGACVLFAENDDCGSWDGSGPRPDAPLLVLRADRITRIDLDGYVPPAGV